MRVSCDELHSDIDSKTDLEPKPTFWRSNQTRPETDLEPKPTIWRSNQSKPETDSEPKPTIWRSNQSACNSELMHCLVVEEEHDMSQHLENYGFHCYRLTHRNASSGAANGLLTQIKNGHFRAVFIHMPVEKRDIQEKKYHAHLLNLASWTRQARSNGVPILWIGPLGNAWNEMDIRNMQNELQLFVAHFRFCNLQLSCRSLEPHQASATCIVTYSSHKLAAVPCRCSKDVEHVLCWYQATHNHRRHAWQRFLTARFSTIVSAFGIVVASGNLKSPGTLGLQATPDLQSADSKPEGQDDSEQNQLFGVLDHKPKGNTGNVHASVVSASGDENQHNQQPTTSNQDKANSFGVLDSKVENPIKPHVVLTSQNQTKQHAFL